MILFEKYSCFKLSHIVNFAKLRQSAGGDYLTRKMLFAALPSLTYSIATIFWIRAGKIFLRQQRSRIKYWLSERREGKIGRMLRSQTPANKPATRKTPALQTFGHRKRSTSAGFRKQKVPQKKMRRNKQPHQITRSESQKSQNTRWSGPFRILQPMNRVLFRRALLPDRQNQPIRPRPRRPPNKASLKKTFVRFDRNCLRVRSFVFSSFLGRFLLVIAGRPALRLGLEQLGVDDLAKAVAVKLRTWNLHSIDIDCRS